MSKGGFRRPASRAGIKDPRASTFITNLSDLEKSGERPDQLSANTCMLRLDDLEELGDPSAEPLGQAPEQLEVASKMIAFFAPKGGVGATSIAINVGGMLSRLGRNTIITDMDFQLGAIPTCLNVKPERSVAELVVETTGAGSGPVQSGLDRHQSGLSFLAQGDRIEELAEITTERLPRLFDALGQSFEFVIVDGLRDFSDHAVSIMDLAHTVVLVITQDVPSVRAAARSLRLFRRLGYGPERLRIVVNRYHRKAPVTLESIHNALGQQVEAVVRNNFPLVEESLNHGIMISDVKPGSGLAKDIDALSRMLGDIPPDKSSGGLFSRLFGRG